MGASKKKKWKWRRNKEEISRLKSVAQKKLTKEEIKELKTK